MSKRKKQIKRIHKRKYIKDNALVNFILQHSKKEKIDFSKLKIPSFSECLKSEKEDFKDFKEKYLDQKNSQTNSSTNHVFPKFRLSLLDENRKDSDTQPDYHFSSFLFQ